MSDSDWQDTLAGDRMAVDREFADRVRDSPLNSQEWNLVMTAVEFEIEGEGDSAQLVADTSKVEHVVPEFENLNQGMGGAGRAGGDSGRSGGLLGSLKGVLGLGGGSGADREKLAAAERLAEEYARELQRHLEENDRWAEVREAAQPSPE